MKKRVISVILVVVMVFTVMVGCKGEKDSSGAVTKNSESKEETNSGKKDLIPIKMPILASKVGLGEEDKIQEFALENGFDLERIVLPDPVPGTPDKLLVSLMAGDEFNLVYSAYSNLKAYHSAGVIEPLQPLAEAAGDDLDSVFGNYLMEFDEEVVGLPAFVDIAMTIYNKNLFDEAGVDYPTLEGWTWEKYIETAKKLTDKENNKWGSFMPAWVHYNFMLAMQKGASVYDEDGNSNLDDPAFAEAMEFYYSLGNDLEIQPSYLVQTSKNLPIDYIMQGNVGMTVIGAWALGSWAGDTDKYPRDWNVGIAPMPYPEGYEPSTSSVVGGYWVPTTASDKEGAYKFAKLLAENQYTLGFGRIPARVDLTDEEKTEYIENELVKAFPESDGITVEQLKATWFNEKTKPFDEKPVGNAATEIKTLFANESQLYGLGEQDIEETMSNIHESVEKAIKIELENK